MKRYLDFIIEQDILQKAVLLVGPRQVGKTTLSRKLMTRFQSAQYLNWDIASDRSIFLDQNWPADTQLLVFDELHKMPNWKSWLKGVIDGKARPDQGFLITGSARMDTWGQSGPSLAGRYFSCRLHPISVREWCEQQGGSPQEALDRLIERGGFPEPCLAEKSSHAQRWRRQYFTDLIREDILEFSRVNEIATMRLFVECLRTHVGSPLSLASIARDLLVSPTTLKRYLDILQALFIVFPVYPWHRHVARSLLKSPKIYFFDTGLVQGDEGVRFENAVATMLLKHAHFLQDTQGQEVNLHYIRTKDGAEVDFALSQDEQLTDLIECKKSDATVSSALIRFAEQFSQAKAVQLVHNLRQEKDNDRVRIRRAAPWLNDLAA